MKLTQSTALEQKCFDLRLLSPALRNLWLLLVYYIFLFACTVAGTFINQSTQVVSVDPGEEFSYDCPQHSPSYGVRYSWQGKMNYVDIPFKRNDRRAISQTGQLVITYVTQDDFDDFAKYDSQGIRCFMTGANRFESSGLLKLKKKNPGKFFVFDERNSQGLGRRTPIPLSICIRIYMQHFGSFPLTWCPSYNIGVNHEIRPILCFHCHTVKK